MDLCSLGIACSAHRRALIVKTYKLIAVLIFLPLCLNLFGVWELDRSSASNHQLLELQANLLQVRPELEAMAASGSHLPMVELEDGERISAEMALSRIHTAENDLRTLIPLGHVMSGLAKAVIVLGLLAALVGGIGMMALHRAGSRALHSRDQLLHSFALASWFLPYLLVGHIITMGASLASILAYECLGIWHAGNMSSGEVKLMMLVLMVMAGFLYSMWRMARQLRIMLHMFEPVSMQELGHEVSEAQAPVLWARVRELARRLGALAPDHIVIGMTQGFYVTSSDVELLPSNTLLKGRTLQVPMVYLGLLDTAQIDAVIGHELAHFAGADTEYSLRFLPIYDGIGRSLQVIAMGMLETDKLQRSILWPAFMLGSYFMESFDHAVNHWSRVRELAADAAGAQLAGNLSAASALLRISAMDALVHQRVEAHIARATNPGNGEAAVIDLPACLIEALAATPLSIPEEEMATQLPHPSDTHPSNGERIASLGIAVDDAVCVAVQPLSAERATAVMDQYFADPHALRSQITQEYFNHYVTQDAVLVETLREQASKVSGTVSLHEGAHLRGLLLLVFCGVLMLGAIALATMAWFSAEPERVRHVYLGGCAALLCVMLLVLPFAWRMRTRAGTTALLLTPDHLVYSNLKAPLPIQHIADFGLVFGKGILLNVLLEDDAPLPEQISQSFFAPSAKVLKKHRWVQLQLLQFCRNDVKLKPQQLADLIGSYLNAGTARHLLEQRFETAKAPTDSTEQSTRLS